MRLKFLALSMIATSAMALAGCGNKGGGGAGEAAPTGPALPEQVSPQEFQGRPGSFAGTWRGECVIEVSGQTARDCTLILKVKQNNGLLDVTMDIKAIMMGNRDSNRSREIYTIRGNQLVGRNGRTGLIGPRVLTLIGPTNTPTQVRTTLLKTAAGSARFTMESISPQFHASLRADLRSANRPLPRARTSARN